jgi:hypothetical protein
LLITSILLITSVGRDDLAFAEVRKCAAEDDVFRAFLLEKFGNKTFPFLFDLTANDVFAQADEETPPWLPGQVSLSPQLEAFLLLVKDEVPPSHVQAYIHLYAECGESGALFGKFATLGSMSVLFSSLSAAGSVTMYASLAWSRARSDRSGGAQAMWANLGHPVVLSLLVLDAAGLGAVVLLVDQFLFIRVPFSVSGSGDFWVYVLVPGLAILLLGSCATGLLAKNQKDKMEKMEAIRSEHRRSEMEAYAFDQDRRSADRRTEEAQKTRKPRGRESKDVAAQDTTADLLRELIREVRFSHPGFFADGRRNGGDPRSEDRQSIRSAEPSLRVPSFGPQDPGNLPYSWKSEDGMSV